MRPNSPGVAQQRYLGIPSSDIYGISSVDVSCLKDLAKRSQQLLLEWMDPGLFKERASFTLMESGGGGQVLEHHHPSQIPQLVVVGRDRIMYGEHRKLT